jgi:hypothetical protein
MDDPSEQDDGSDLLPIERCRQLLGDEAIDVADEDIEAIRRHAHALAHTLIEVFLNQPSPGDAELRLTSQDHRRG